MAELEGDKLGTKARIGGEGRTVELLRRQQGAPRTKTVLISPCSPQLDGEETDMFSGDRRGGGSTSVTELEGKCSCDEENSQAELLDAHSPVTGKGQSGPSRCHWIWFPCYRLLLAS